MHNVYVNQDQDGWRLELDSGAEAVVHRLAEVETCALSMIEETGPLPSHERALTVSFDAGGSALAAGHERTQLVALAGFISNEEELVVTKAYDRAQRYVEINMVTYEPAIATTTIRVDRTELQWLMTALNQAAREMDTTARMRSLGSRPPPEAIVGALLRKNLRAVTPTLPDDDATPI